MRINIDLWDSKDRMRERIRNIATMVLSLSAVNGFTTFGENWLVFGINCLFFITTLPIFISYSKWRMKPPKENEN